MRVNLSDRVSYRDLAEREALVEGAVRVADCSRLHGLADASGQLALEATLARDPRGVRLTGRVDGEVTLTCRRCLGPVAWSVDRPVDLVVVGSEAGMRELADDVEAHHAPELRGRLVDILQEEVLLALPDHPGHAPGCCSTPPAPAAVEVADEEQAHARQGERQTQRPFAVLEVLRKPPHK